MLSDSFWNPLCPYISIWRHRGLVFQLTKRDLVQRYRGSAIGLVWTFLTPLFFLLIYTFVFNVVMKARWADNPQEGTMEFTIGLFCGLILWNIFAESVIVAPVLIINNSGYVLKTIFPLEILPVITVMGALVRASVAIVILLGTIILFGKVWFGLTFLLLPLTGMLFFALGMAWFLSALGVFVRDVGHVVSILVTLFFFLTPIVYPASRVPEKFRAVIYINPFTPIIETARAASLNGSMPSMRYLFVSIVFAAIVCHTGFIFFMKSKKAFADVI